MIFRTKDNCVSKFTDIGIYWFQNGKIHRDDGPAYISSYGNTHWFQNGQYHREDGPAIIHSNGVKSWFKYGVRHRKDGPAIIHPDFNFFYIEGVRYDDEEDYWEKVKNDL